MSSTSKEEKESLVAVSNNNNNIHHHQNQQQQTTSSLTQKNSPPLKKTHIRVSSGEIATSAAAVLNKLSTIPSSMTNKQYQQNTFVRVSVVAVLCLACILLATDLLSRTTGNSARDGGSRTSSNRPRGSSVISGGGDYQQDVSSPSSNSPPASFNNNNNEQTSTTLISTEVPKQDPEQISASSSSSTLFPYFIDTSDYWSQPGPQLFTGAADPKLISNGVIYEKDMSNDNRINEKLGRKIIRKQSELFSCFYESENAMNDDFELSDDKDGSSSSLFNPPSVSKKKSSSSSSSLSISFYQYDFVLFPVGCFGDVVPRNYNPQAPSPNACPSTSCKALNVLSGFVPCGKRPIGLILGDNFYPNGLAHRRDTRINTDFGAKFLRHKMFNFPWFGTVGNHDHKPYLQYRNLKNVMWVMPEAHHATPKMISSSSSSSKFSIQVFLISTQWGYDSNWPHMQQEAQWLDNQLSNSDADIKIVASHEPMYTFLGFEHSRPLIHFIDPILRKHGVSLFIAAHAHSIHLHRCPGGYYQLVSAGFADNLHQGVRNMRPRGHFYIGRGSSAVAVNSSHVVVTAMDLEARNVFNFAFEWRKLVGEIKTKSKKIFKYRNTPNYSTMDVPPEGAKFESQFNFEPNNEIGNSEIMWRHGKLCDKTDKKMSAWWC